MSRPNKPRSIAGELSLARRIAYEREQRGWSLEGLAKRMTDAGCAINQSAIYKIEKGDPPRRITVDELIALGRVFGMPLEDLVVDPDLEASRELRRLCEDLMAVEDEAAALMGRLDAAKAAIEDYAQAHSEAVAIVEKFLKPDPQALRYFRKYVKRGGK